MSKTGRLLGVKPLWHSGYWDGPLSGMCRYKNQDYWFWCITDTDDPTSRRKYAVVELTDKEMVYEKQVHTDFRKWVGTHTDYDETYRRVSDGSGVHPQSMHDNFYSKYPPGRFRHEAYKERPSIGWFTWPRRRTT